MTVSNQQNFSKPIKIWARVTRGIEWIAAAEASVHENINNIRTTHRNLFLSCSDIMTVHKLRCIDDAYIIWAEVGGISHTRAALAYIPCHLNQLPEIDLNLNNIKMLRVTASILGKHNYSRYEVEDSIGHMLSKRFNLNYVDSKDENTNNVLWCRVHIAEGKLLIGFRTHQQPLHRRLWHTNGLAGALHPPVAAAMAFLADLHPGQCVIDPFCGSGTLLIEAGLRLKHLNLIGYDISTDAISSAYEQARQAGVKLDLHNCDSSQITLPPTNRMMTNPPWNCAVKAGGALNNDNMIDIILQNLQHGGRAVLLTDVDLNLPQLLAKKCMQPLLLETIRTAGRLAHLTVIGFEPMFTNTAMARSLAKAWQHQRIIEEYY